MQYYEQMQQLKIQATSGDIAATLGSLLKKGAEIKENKACVNNIDIDLDGFCHSMPGFVRLSYTIKELYPNLNKLQLWSYSLREDNEKNAHLGTIMALALNIIQPKSCHIMFSNLACMQTTSAMWHHFLSPVRVALAGRHKLEHLILDSGGLDFSQAAINHIEQFIANAVAKKISLVGRVAPDVPVQSIVSMLNAVRSGNKVDGKLVELDLGNLSGGYHRESNLDVALQYLNASVGNGSGMATKSMPKNKM